MPVTVKRLGPHDADILSRVAAGVFDYPLRADLTKELLVDARHHLVVAIDSGTVVGVASGVHYVHPDKPPELWINEVGVTASHQGQGIASELLKVLFDVGRQYGCREAWVLTDRQNEAAMRLYTRCGGREAEQEQVMFNFDLGNSGSP